MKKNPNFKMSVLGALCFSLSQFALGQSTAADIFSSKTSLSWMGVDFTQVKVLGETGTVSTVEMINLFAKINDVVINESEKYNFKEALNRMEVPYDLDPVTKANAGIDPDKLLSNSSAEKDRITVKSIDGMVKPYVGGTGIGLVFFMETLDKPSELGVMWVTFFDRSSGKVLLTEKMSGKALGFGFRNHWARPVYEVIKEIKKSKYKTWKINFGK